MLHVTGGVLLGISHFESYNAKSFQTWRRTFKIDGCQIPIGWHKPTLKHIDWSFEGLARALTGLKSARRRVPRSTHESAQRSADASVRVGGYRSPYKVNQLKNKLEEFLSVLTVDATKLHVRVSKKAASLPYMIHLQLHLQRNLATMIFSAVYDTFMIVMMTFLSTRLFRVVVHCNAFLNSDMSLSQLHGNTCCGHLHVLPWRVRFWKF